MNRFLTRLSILTILSGISCFSCIPPDLDIPDKAINSIPLSRYTPGIEGSITFENEGEYGFTNSAGKDDGKVRISISGTHPADWKPFFIFCLDRKKVERNGKINLHHLYKEPVLFRIILFSEGVHDIVFGAYPREEGTVTTLKNGILRFSVPGQEDVFIQLEELSGPVEINKEYLQILESSK